MSKLRLMLGDLSKVTQLKIGIHSFNEDFMRMCYVPSTDPSSRNITENKRDKYSCPHETYTSNDKRQIIEICHIAISAKEKYKAEMRYRKYVCMIPA